MQRRRRTPPTIMVNYARDITVEQVVRQIQAIAEATPHLPIEIIISEILPRLDWPWTVRLARTGERSSWLHGGSMVRTLNYMHGNRRVSVRLAFTRRSRRTVGVGVQDERTVGHTVWVPVGPLGDRFRARRWREGNRRYRTRNARLHGSSSRLGRWGHRWGESGGRR